MSTLLTPVSRAVSTKSSVFYKLRSLQNCFDIESVKDYDEISKLSRAYKQNLELNSSDQILFIDKSIKNFNLEEVKELVQLDTQYTNVKFKLVTDNTQLNESSINPNFRRLLNNGLYYGIYMNSPEQCRKYISNLSNVTKSLKQVYLSESISLRKNSNKFIEFPNNQIFKIPVKINDVDYLLETPAISILVNMQAIGIPSNHPHLNELLDLSRIENPIKKGEFLPLIRINEESDNLIALIPKHILNHRNYIPTNLKVLPGLIKFENTEYSYSQLSLILSKRLNIKPRLFEIIPFIVEKHAFDDTITVNNSEVLNRNFFPNIKVIEDSNISLWKNRSNGTSLKSIPNFYISKCIDFKKSFERKLITNVEINPDILRSVILRNDMTANYLFEDAHLTLILTNEFLQYYLNIYNFKDEKFIWNLKELASYPYDFTILRKFNALTNNEIQLGDFMIHLIDYLTIDKEFRQGENPLLFNIILRLLKDQLTYQFPELSSYYQNELKIKDIELAYEEGFELNKWQNYIRYPIIPVDFNINKKNINDGILDDLPSIISSLYKINQLPEPYSFVFNIKSSPQFSIVENLELIKKISAKIGFNSFLNFKNSPTDKIYILKEIYKNESTSIQIGSKVNLFLNTEPWIKRLKPMKFIEDNKNILNDISLFKLKFQEYLIQDINDNILINIKENFETKEISSIVIKLENYVKFFAKNKINNKFINDFKIKYNKYEPIVKDMNRIEDVDLKINEFNKIL